MIAFKENVNMVTCVVMECRSGYKPKKAEQNDDRGTKEKVHWHKFPDDKVPRGMCKSKIPREKHRAKWEVTDHNRICHKHFLPKVYIRVRKN